MKCLLRRKLVNPLSAPFSDDYYMSVGCGRCYSCLSNRRRSWLFRLGIEAINSFSSFFVTLTYNDDSLPSALVPSHLSDFLSQLSFKHKYYAIGEYGPNTLRPHYHLIVFAKEDVLSFLDIERHFNACWSKGFVTVSNAFYIRLNYILHYHTRPKNPFGDLVTFYRASKGLGRDFIYNKDGSFKSDIVAYCAQGGRIVQDLEGNYFVIPRYYTRKMENAGLIPPLSWSSDNELDPLDDFFIRSSGDRKLYQISDCRFDMLLRNLLCIDDGRLFGYNFQNKYHTEYV